VPPVRDPADTRARPRTGRRRHEARLPENLAAKSASQALCLAGVEPANPLGEPSPVRLQNPCAEYTLSHRSREARAPPEPNGFQLETGLFDPEIKIFSLPGKRKSLPGLATPEGFRIRNPL
jgi:hypothetical protein